MHLSVTNDDQFLDRNKKKLKTKLTKSRNEKGKNGNGV